MFARLTSDALPKIIDSELKLYWLCDLERLLNIALSNGSADSAQLNEINSFLDDPKGWSNANEK